MKSKKVLLGLLAIMLAFGMVVIGCDPDDDSDKEKNQDPPYMGTITGAEGTPWWIEDVAAGQTFDVSIAGGEVTVIVGGTPNVSSWRTLLNYKYPSFAFEAGKRYKISFDARTETGTRQLTTNYIFSGSGTTEEVNFLFPEITITEAEQTFTMVTRNIPHYAVMTEQNFKFFCANVIGTFYIKNFSIVETTDPATERALSDRIGRWISSEPVAAGISLNLEVLEDSAGDYVKVTRSGTELPNEGWRAQFHYGYDGEIGKRYKYIFNAWTDSGTYEFGNLTYDWNPDTERNAELSTGIYSRPFVINNDSTKVYTLIGPDALTFAGYSNITFECAKMNGTFYLRFISVEATDEEPEEAIADFLERYTHPDFDINLDYTVINNDYIQITVTGDDASMDNHWIAELHYLYSRHIELGKAYTFKFNAWVDSGNFTIGAVKYETYQDPDNNDWINNYFDTAGYGTDLYDHFRWVIGTDQNYEYSFTIPALTIPFKNHWEPRLKIECGGQESTFYLRIVDIVEVP